MADANNLSLEEQILRWQKRIEAGSRSLRKRSFFRIIRFARKPDAAEYRRLLLINSIGLILLGAIGFTVSYLMNSAIDDIYKPVWHWMTVFFGF